MVQLIIGDLNERALLNLTNLANQKGHSLHEEVKQLLEREAAAAETDIWDKIRKIREEIASRGIPQTDSVLLIREDRDRDVIRY